MTADRKETRERLTVLREHLVAWPAERLDMGMWRVGECRCLLGLACESGLFGLKWNSGCEGYPRISSGSSGYVSGFISGSEAFGITVDESMELFGFREEDDDIVTVDPETRKASVLERLDRFIASLEEVQQ